MEQKKLSYSYFTSEFACLIPAETKLMEDRHKTPAELEELQQKGISFRSFRFPQRTGIKGKKIVDFITRYDLQTYQLFHFKGWHSGDFYVFIYYMKDEFEKQRKCTICKVKKGRKDITWINNKAVVCKRCVRLEKELGSIESVFEYIKTNRYK